MEEPLGSVNPEEDTEVYLFESTRTQFSLGANHRTQWIGCSHGQKDAATLCIYMPCAHQHGSKITFELSTTVFDKWTSWATNQ